MSSSIHKNGNFPRDSFNESYVKPVELTYSSRGFFKIFKQNNLHDNNSN